jgi:hypothetical protein
VKPKKSGRDLRTSSRLQYIKLLNSLSQKETTGTRNKPRPGHFMYHAFYRYVCSCISMREQPSISSHHTQQYVVKSLEVLGYEPGLMRQELQEDRRGKYRYECKYGKAIQYPRYIHYTVQTNSLTSRQQ